MSIATEYFAGPNGHLAYRLRRGVGTCGPGVFWLGGFRSDMTGTKAEFVDAWARANNRPFLRFDYSGHGESDGAFEDGCIGEWAADAEAILTSIASGPQVLVGSSMGGWIATLLALRHPEKVAAIVYIAPAPDFTEMLMWPSLSDEQREQIMRKGRIEVPSDNAEEPEIITRKLIEDGRNHRVMPEEKSGRIAITQPVRILQGMKDEAVPFAHVIAFAERLESADVEILLIPNGDHRLSTPADLERLARLLGDF